MGSLVGSYTAASLSACPLRSDRQLQRVGAGLPLDDAVSEPLDLREPGLQLGHVGGPLPAGAASPSE